MMVSKEKDLMNLVNVSFSNEDWGLICKALTVYSDAEHDRLSKLNVGDREWDELCHLKAITRDLEYFVIGELSEYKTFDL